jgi:hypothetical protein
MDELTSLTNQIYYDKLAILFKTEILSSILRMFKNKPPSLNKPLSKQNRFRWKTVAAIYSPAFQIANFGLGCRA